MSDCLTFQNDPELAQILLGNDLNKMQELLQARHRQRSELQRQKDEEMVSVLTQVFWGLSRAKDINL